MSQIQDICKKYDKDPKDKVVIELRKILEKHLGYFPKFAKWVFKGETTIEETRNIIDLLKMVKISKPIGQFKTSEELYDHIHELQNKRKLNQIVKSIPSKSRRNISKRIKEAIYNNIEKEDLFKDFFSKKGGTCKTEDDLYQRTMEIINSGGNYSYKSVLGRIRTRLSFSRLNWRFKSGGKIVYKDGKTIIVKINNFKASALLGSKHWCISRDYTYWNSYTSEDRTQYFIYQTEYERSDKKSMIGVTVHPVAGHIHAAHYKNDQGCPTEELEKFTQYLKGKNIPVTSIEELIKYNIHDLNVLYTIPNWKRHLSFTPNINEILNSGGRSSYGYGRYDTMYGRDYNGDYDRYYDRYARIAAGGRGHRRGMYVEERYFQTLSNNIKKDIETHINMDIVDRCKYQNLHEEPYFIHCLENLEVYDPRLFSLTFYVSEQKAFEFFSKKYEKAKVNILMEKLIFSKFIVHFRKSQGKIVEYRAGNITDKWDLYDGSRRINRGDIVRGNDRINLNGRDYSDEQIRNLVSELISNYTTDAESDGGPMFISNPTNEEMKSSIEEEKDKLEKRKDEIIFLPVVEIIDSLDFKMDGEKLKFLKTWEEVDDKLDVVKKFYNKCIDNKISYIQY